MVRDCAMAAMERSVEAGHLQQIRPARQQRAYRRQIVRLVQGRKRTVSLQMRQNVRIDDNRSIVVGAAVNDAVAYGDEFHRLCFLQPIAGGRHRGRDVGDLFRRIGFIDQVGAVACFDAQPRQRADAVKLTLDEPLRLPTELNVEYLKFDARRARVDNQNRIPLCVTPRERWP